MPLCGGAGCPSPAMGWRAGDMHGTTGPQWLAGGECAACNLSNPLFSPHRAAASTLRRQARAAGAGIGRAGAGGKYLIALTGWEALAWRAQGDALAQGFDEWVSGLGCRHAL